MILVLIFCNLSVLDVRRLRFCKWVLTIHFKSSAMVGVVFHFSLIFVVVGGVVNICPPFSFAARACLMSRPILV